jgi:hypothetical protein
MSSNKKNSNNNNVSNQLKKLELKRSSKRRSRSSSPQSSSSRSSRNRSRSPKREYKKEPCFNCGNKIKNDDYSSFECCLCGKVCCLEYCHGDCDRIYDAHCAFCGEILNAAYEKIRNRKPFNSAQMTHYRSKYNIKKTISDRNFG